MEVEVEVIIGTQRVLEVMKRFFPNRTSAAIAIYTCR
jgi:vancomycin permeability regulator SanA